MEFYYCKLKNKKSKNFFYLLQVYVYGVFTE